MTDVVLFHDDDCPNVEATREVLRSAFEAVSREPTWREVKRSDEDLPHEWRNFGSPTVLVNGHDVAGEDAACCEGGSCRLYTGPDGQLGGVPPVDQIVNALREGGEPPDGGRGAKFAAAGAVATALGVSACCVGPLALAALGLGGAATFAGIAAYQEWFIGATVLLIGSAFHLQRRNACTDEACAADGQRTRRTRHWLWGAAFLAAVLTASPWLLAHAFGGDPIGTHQAGVSRAVIGVGGIDCEACAAPIQKALDEVGGVRGLSLDVDAQTVTVAFDGPDDGRLARYEAAIAELGYEVTAARRARAGGR